MHSIDVVVMALYGAVVLAIGLWVGRGRQSESDLFLGSRRIPAWAAFGSMVATEISAATFVAVPATGFQSSWAYLQIGIGSLCARLFLAQNFLPLYYQLRVTTVYQFLGERFGRASQLGSAWLFLGGRLLASGTRLYIAALAFSIVTDLLMGQAVVIAGGLALAYTLFGGIRAVIWTDVLQGSVFIVAGVATIIAIGLAVPGGWSEILSAASLEGKTTIFHFPDVTAGVEPGLGAWVAAVFGRTDPMWVAVLAGFFLTLATHGTDQDMVQRLLTPKNVRGSGRALVASGFATIPVAAIFLMVGTGLWYFYSQAAPTYDTSNTSQIYPLYVLHEIPIGLKGLIFAGLFAAAMSSMDSALNSMATTWIVDIRGRGGELGAEAASRIPQPEQVREIRVATLAFGVFLIGAALACIEYRERNAASDHTLIDFALSSMTVLYGGLLGAFLVGLLTARGNDRSVIAGMVVAAVVGVVFLLQPIYLGRTVVAWPWWIMVGTAISFAVGWSGRSRLAEEPTA